MKADRDSLDGLAEGRAWLETFRRGGDSAFAATRVAPAEQAHTRDVRLDGRQFNAVVDLLRCLLGRSRSLATGAGIERSVILTRVLGANVIRDLKLMRVLGSIVRSF